jgi:hypothetical protein
MVSPFYKNEYEVSPRAPRSREAFWFDLESGNSEKACQNGLLGVQPVMCLREDNRMRPIRNIVGQLMVAVRRQAVHHNNIFIGF